MCALDTNSSFEGGHHSRFLGQRVFSESCSFCLLTAEFFLLLLLLISNCALKISEIHSVLRYLSIFVITNSTTSGIFLFYLPLYYCVYTDLFVILTVCTQIYFTALLVLSVLKVKFHSTLQNELCKTCVQ